MDLNWLPIVASVLAGVIAFPFARMADKERERRRVLLERMEEELLSPEAEGRPVSAEVKREVEELEASEPSPARSRVTVALQTVGAVVATF